MAHGSHFFSLKQNLEGETRHIYSVSLCLSLSPPPPISLLTLSLLAYLSIIYWNTFPLIYLLCLPLPLLHSLVHLSPRRQKYGGLKHNQGEVGLHENSALIPNLALIPATLEVCLLRM